MWLMLNNAFLSVVHKECGPDELLVRSRRPGDIEKVFPDAVVRESLGTDYRYRSVMPRSVVADAMARVVDSIDYPNFKGSTHDNKLHDAYMGVWKVMAPLQPGGPYARR
jgi:hypothetical protein